MMSDVKGPANNESGAVVTAGNSQAGRRTRMFLFRLILGLGLFAWLALLVDWGQIAELLLEAEPWSLLGAFLLIVAMRLLSALKWRVLVHAKQLYAPYSFLLRVVFVSNFLGVFLPTGIGVDAVRMYSLSRVYKHAADSVSSVIVERLIGMTALLAVLIAGACLSIGDPLGRILVPNALVPGGLLFFVLAVLLSPVGYRFTHWLTGLVVARYSFDFLMRVDAAVRTYGQFPGAVMKSLALSAGVQVCRIMSVYLAVVSLGIGLSFVDAFILIPPAIFIGMLPVTVGGFGVREGAMVVLLGLAGIPATEAFAVALIIRVANLASDLPGGALLVSSGLMTGWMAGECRNQPAVQREADPAAY